MPDSLLSKVTNWAMSGPACPVSRRLVEGDEVGGFRVLEAPGHSPGHVVYWRESDRVLILGDVLTNMNLFTTIPGLHEPPAFFTPDPASNRRSARRLIEMGLEPSLVCFGHGPPLFDTMKFVEFIRRLPV
jgi:glyoxylase-like metal-dependent hydrolase (beta-lactamase superfamily II)